MKKFNIIMLMIIITSLTACSSLKSMDEVSEDVKISAESQLKEKYGEEFEAYKVFGKPTLSEYTVYVHPVSNPDMNFTASLNGSKKLESDTYVNHKIYENMSRYFKQNVTEEIEIQVLAMKNQPNKSIEINKDTSLSEYVDATNPSYFSGKAIIKENDKVTPEMFRNAFQTMYQDLDNKPFQLRVYVIKSEEFDAVKKEFLQPVYVNNSFFSDYNVVDEFGIMIDEKGFQYVIK